MKVLICYTLVANGDSTAFFVERFVSTFLQFPPKHDFTLVTVCNGGPPPAAIGDLLKGGVFSRFLVRENVGADIGGFIEMARRETAQEHDAILCLGESVYFHRPRWLERIAEVWDKHGPGLYGFYASNLVRKHLNTTAFCVDPRLLQAWPEVVKTREQRYAFEHGPMPFWKRVEGLRRPVRLVMWDHNQAPWEWRAGKVENEFWRGDQSQCLMFCQHTDRFKNAVKGTRTVWTNNADRGLLNSK